MSKVQKLQLRQSEIRGEMGVLLDLETRSEEQVAQLKTLSKELQTTETELQAALLVEQEPVETRQANEDGEARELRQLREKVHVSDYVGAALEQRSVDGPALEYNQAYKIAGNRFPLMLLADEEPVETRSVTSEETVVRPRRWVDRLFSGSMAERIGVTFESVEPGVASFPVMTGGGSGQQRGKGQAAVDSAWTMSVMEGKPKRHPVSLKFSQEDTMRVPSLEQALIRDMRASIMESVDRVVFLGDDGANPNDGDIAGLSTVAGVVAKSLTQANKVKGDEVLKVFVELVDGIHAERIGDLRIVVSVGSNVLWYSTVHAAAVENQTVAQFLMASGLTWLTRGGIDEATAAADFGAFVGRSRGIQGAAVAPVWSSAELIRDPYTGAKKGEVVLTLAYYWDFVVPRPSNYARLAYAA